MNGRLDALLFALTRHPAQILFDFLMASSVLIDGILYDDATIRWNEREHEASGNLTAVVSHVTVMMTPDLDPPDLPISSYFLQRASKISITFSDACPC